MPLQHMYVVDISDLIGEGAFSHVYHSSYQGQEVALKRLKVPLTSQDRNYFMAEVRYIGHKPCGPYAVKIHNHPIFKTKVVLILRWS